MPANGDKQKLEKTARISLYPKRFSNELRYLTSNFLSSLGTGLILTVQVVFVTQNLNITPVHFGVALTCGAMLGLVAGVALGKWSDGRNLR